MKIIGWIALSLAIGIALSGLETGCRKAELEATDDKEEASGPEWFEDITDKVGLDFVHDPGPTGNYFMPQIMASGCAIFDFDNTGRPGIYLLSNGGPHSKSTNRLYRQLPNGKLVDVTKRSGLGIAGYNTGVAIGDFNNDGWNDVLVTQYGGIRLFLNNRDGTFTDVTKESGLENRFWGSSAAFVDLDRDGWLDLVVVNYVDYDPSQPCNDPNGHRDYCHPQQFNGRITKIYRNLGPQADLKPGRVRFEDITISAGLGQATGPGLGIICADFDGDGWPDIFVANDLKANRLWINNGKGTHFKDEALSRHVAYNAQARAQANMGVALGDVDGDGRLDLYVTHLTDEYHTLWMQSRGPKNPRGMYQDQTAAAGLATPRWRGTGFGTAMMDFDHDGNLDIAVTNGRVSRSGMQVKAPGVAEFWRPYAERNQLFTGDGQGRFRDISQQNGVLCGSANLGRGLACADFDGDGAMDILINYIGGRARLYRNIAPKKGHWLMVRALLDKKHGQRDAIGAEITIRAGRRQWIGLANPAYSYLSSNDPRGHFGLGKITRVESIHVAWPDGKREVFPGSPCDRVVTVRHGQGKFVKGAGVK